MIKNDNFSWSATFKEVIYFFSYIIVAVIASQVIDMTIKPFPDAGIRPIFAPEYLIRSLLTFLLSLLLIVLFLKINTKNQNKNVLTPSYQESNSWLGVSLNRKKRIWCFAGVIFFSIFYLAVFFHDKALFRDLSSDEKLVENLSAAFCLISSIICIITAVRLFKSKIEGVRLYGYMASVFAFIFFVICMEETGWGHGVFFFEPPEYMIRGNSQGEMNFHNHATHYFEIAYYFSTFLFFVVLPFFNDFRSAFRKIPVISFFIPSRLMVYVGAMAMAYNYDIWNHLIPQLSFYVTMIILGYYAWIDSGDKHTRALKIIFGLYLISQVSFLMFGDGVDRTSSFKEYKEFFIPLTFLIYSFELSLRSKLAVSLKKLQ